MSIKPAEEELQQLEEDFPGIYKDDTKLRGVMKRKGFIIDFPSYWGDKSEYRKDEEYE